MNASSLVPFVLFFSLSAGLTAHAATERKNLELPGRLQTHLTADEIKREVLDEQRFPNMMKYLRSVDISKNIKPTDPRNKHLIPTTTMFVPTQELWNGFFKAAVADKMTVLRGFAMLAREVKRHGIPLSGPGGVFEEAVAQNHIDLGLALPATNIASSVWRPDPDNKDPEFQCHLKVFYTHPFVHKFPDNILPANLKIGYGDEETYWSGGQEFKQHTIDADIYYGPTQGIGFRNVKGVGGQKRGLLGFFQKVLFFLPDAVQSMSIDEKKDAMITEALVNTTVEHFETTPLYAIKKVE